MKYPGLNTPNADDDRNPACNKQHAANRGDHAEPAGRADCHEVERSTEQDDSEDEGIGCERKVAGCRWQAGGAKPNEDERYGKNCQAVHELIGETGLEPLEGLGIKAWTKSVRAEGAEQHA